MTVSDDRVVRRAGTGLWETVSSGGGAAEHHLMGCCTVGESAVQMGARVARRVRESAAKAAAMTAFDVGDWDAWERGVREILGDGFPITRIETLGPEETRGAGVEVLAVSGATVAPIFVDARAIGATWSDSAGRHCVLGDLRATDVSLTEGEQTSLVLDQMVRGLGGAGMRFSHVFRTWFRNDRIVEWYPEFNRVRTAAYKALRVFDGVLPASTGIGAKNPHRAALVAGLRACVPHGEGVCCKTVESPLQNAATRYGSSFSRAVECDFGDRRLLTVSGTASIGLDGLTKHVGDAEKQVELTLDVVQAILSSRGMDWRSVSRGLAYLRHGTDIGTFWRVWRERGLAAVPVLLSVQTVCRDDLLFEIEVDAVA